MTKSEEQLIAALESDIQLWEAGERHYAELIPEIQAYNGSKTETMSGRQYGARFRQRIQEHRALIAQIRGKSD